AFTNRWMAWNARPRCRELKTSSSRQRWGNTLSRCPKAQAIWDSFSRAAQPRRAWKPRCGGAMPNSASRSRPRLKPSGLRPRGDEIGGQGRAFAEEVSVHLLDQELLRFL